jgi:hypothetical protein
MEHSMKGDWLTGIRAVPLGFRTRASEVPEGLELRSWYGIYLFLQAWMCC